MELIEKVSPLKRKVLCHRLPPITRRMWRKALLGLGFVREDFNRQTSDFSGGWRMRIELAKLLLQKPDVLLLDEPTNHLDIESINGSKISFISNGKAVIVISHDRKFVDNITTRTIEVTMGRIYDYKVNYIQIPGTPQGTPRTATESLRRPAEVHCRNQGIHRTVQRHLLQNPASAKPRKNAGEAGTAGSG